MNLRVCSKSLGFYWRIWKRIFKSSLMRGHIYRQDIIIHILRSFYVLFAQIILLNVVFSDMELYVGWSKSEAYLVIGIWNVLNYLGWGLFGINLIYLERKVLDGSFDYILLKPLPADWLASFGDFFMYNVVTALTGIILIAYYLISNWFSLSILNFLFAILAMFIAMFVWYCIYLIFASFTIANPRNGLLSIAKEVLGITKYPIDIFGSGLSFLFYIVTPLAFLTTVPAKFFMGNISPIYLLYALILGILLYVFAKFLWKWNICRYESASS